jgi:hypothetical protein
VTSPHCPSLYLFVACSPSHLISSSHLISHLSSNRRVAVVYQAGFSGMTSGGPGRGSLSAVCAYRCAFACGIASIRNKDTTFHNIDRSNKPKKKKKKKSNAKIHRNSSTKIDDGNVRAGHRAGRDRGCAATTVPQPGAASAARSAPAGSSPLPTQDSRYDTGQTKLVVRRLAREIHAIAMFRLLQCNLSSNVPRFGGSVTFCVCKIG